MRLLIFFLLLSGVCQAQSLLSKPITLSRQSGTVQELLTELNGINGVNISYSSEVIELTRKVQLSGAEKTLEDILKIIIRGQAVRYVEQDGKIFIVATAPLKKNLPSVDTSPIKKAVSG